MRGRRSIPPGTTGLEHVTVASPDDCSILGRRRPSATSERLLSASGACSRNLLAQLARSRVRAHPAEKRRSLQGFVVWRQATIRSAGCPAPANDAPSKRLKKGGTLVTSRYRRFLADYGARKAGARAGRQRFGRSRRHDHAPARKFAGHRMARHSYRQLNDHGRTSRPVAGRPGRCGPSGSSRNFAPT